MSSQERRHFFQAMPVFLFFFSGVSVPPGPVSADGVNTFHQLFLPDCFPLFRWQHFPHPAVDKIKLVLISPPLVQQTDIMAVDDASGGLLVMIKSFRYIHKCVLFQI